MSLKLVSIGMTEMSYLTIGSLAYATMTVISDTLRCCSWCNGSDEESGWQLLTADNITAYNIFGSHWYGAFNLEAEYMTGRCIHNAVINRSEP